MAMLDFEKQREIVTTANQFDVCITCANELAKEKNITLNNAKVELEGDIKNESVIKFSEVTTTVICKHCIKKFHDKLFPQTEAPEKEPVEKDTNNETKSPKTKK